MSSWEAFICQQADFFRVIWWYFGLNVRWLCVVVDSRISAAKACDFRMVLTDLDRHNSGMWLRDWAGSRYSFSARVLGFEPFKPVSADETVIICVLCFNQLVIYSMRNRVVYRTAKKVVFVNYLSCFVSLYRATFSCSSRNIKICRLKWHQLETSRVPGVVNGKKSVSIKIDSNQVIFNDW